MRVFTLYVLPIVIAVVCMVSIFYGLNSIDVKDNTNQSQKCSKLAKSLKAQDWSLGDAYSCTMVIDGKIVKAGRL